MNGANSLFLISNLKCDPYVAYEISFKMFVMELVVFVGSAYGGQDHLNNY
jgi:hypothetical protein